MRQYTNREQTAKLIELGFEKPKGWCNEGISSRLIMAKHKADDEGFNYSIGELISFCPRRIGYWDLSISCDYAFERWVCILNPENQYGVATELVDALFNLLIKLKEEEVV